MNHLYLIIAIILATNIGFVAGILLKSASDMKSCAGYLNIDHSIPGEINFFADLDIPVEEISSRMYVMFQVKNVNYLEDKNNE